MKNLRERLEWMDAFRGIREETLDLLVEKGRVIHYEKGDMVFNDQQELWDVYISLSGSFSLFKLSSAGEKKVIFHFGEGYILNENLAIDRNSAIYCQAYISGDILQIHKRIFVEAMFQDRVLNRNVIAMWELRIRRLYRQLKNTSGSLRIDKRLAAKLWKLSRDYGVERSEGTCISINPSVTYLAELLGTKRETVSRQMRVLADKGLIVQKGKKIYIPSREKLQLYFKEP